MDLETFRRFWRISGAFGLITSLISFVLGTLAWAWPGAW
ncbi:MAG: hypothetical protein KDD78_14090 [Caldilineaceae bacterium]|nr:hypothetical protein [Caldilineaceae bacterium]